MLYHGWQHADSKTVLYTSLFERSEDHPSIHPTLRNNTYTQHKRIFQEIHRPMNPKVHYYKYINFTTYFDYPLHDTALNTSGAFNGSALAVLVSPNRVVAWTSRHGRGTASAGHRLGASLPAQSLTKPRKD